MQILVVVEKGVKGNINGTIEGSGGGIVVLVKEVVGEY